MTQETYRPTLMKIKKQKVRFLAVLAKRFPKTVDVFVQCGVIAIETDVSHMDLPSTNRGLLAMRPAPEPRYQGEL